MARVNRLRQHQDQPRGEGEGLARIEVGVCVNLMIFWRVGEGISLEKIKIRNRHRLM